MSLKKQNNNYFLTKSERKLLKQTFKYFLVVCTSVLGGFIGFYAARLIGLIFGAGLGVILGELIFHYEKYNKKTKK